MLLPKSTISYMQRGKSVVIVAPTIAHGPRGVVEGSSRGLSLFVKVAGDCGGVRG